MNYHVVSKSKIVSRWMSEIQKYIQDIRYGKMNIFRTRENSSSWKWLYTNRCRFIALISINDTDDMIFDLQIIKKCNWTIICYSPICKTIKFMSRYNSTCDILTLSSDISSVIIGITISSSTFQTLLISPPHYIYYRILSD